MSVTDSTMFPDRVDVLRHADPVQNEFGEMVEGSIAGPTAVPCLIGPSLPMASDLPTPEASVSHAITFPADPGLAPTDILAELDHLGVRTGRGFGVVMCRRVGIRHLRRWQADCAARDPRGVDRP